MPENKINILCTRPVDDLLQQAAHAKGIVLDTVSFIETEAIQTIAVQQEVEQAAIQLATVVFTSMNAVEAVTGILDGHVPHWRIYCIGYRTKALIEEYFGNHMIAGTADSARELAELIIEDNNTDEVIFFCGDQRRQELPGKLEENNIQVNEIIVYQTIAINHTIEKAYDAVLFFSPSAVDSFFTKNKLSNHTIVYAIGITTEQTIRKYCSNRIMVSKVPGKENMVEQAIAYFERGT